MNLDLRIALQEATFKDCQNVFSSQGRLQTRHGISKFNATALTDSVLSLSHFINNAGTVFILAKVGTVLYKVTATANTAIKTGLTATTKHRAITHNNRHIIAIESDGLFSYDGTTFTQLGQASPTAPTVAKNEGGGTIAAGVWAVAISYYSSTYGFETNSGASSSNLTLDAGNDAITVTDIPITASNAFIDKVRVYLKDVSNAGGWIFVEELSLGIASTSITEEPSSTTVAPTTHSALESGGGKYLTMFNQSLVYAGNATFKSDVFISETDLPDAFDDTASGIYASGVRLSIPGSGPITGLATGLYGDSVLDPFLVIFKKDLTAIYSDISGEAKLVIISHDIGCVSSDTIQIKNGSVIFLSSSGWRMIANGSLIKDEQGDAVTLGQGAVDDIFRESGTSYSVSKSQFANYFSTLLPTFDQYLCWTTEESTDNFNTAFVYQFNNRGFTKYNFPIYGRSATFGKDENENDVIYIGDKHGWIYTHSMDEAHTDIDADDVSTTIDAFAVLNWIDNSDYDTNFNFRELMVRAFASDNTIEVRTWVNYNLLDSLNYDYDFPFPQVGFILDVSYLDIDIITDGRDLATARADINRTGENILIGFYQNVADGNMNLITAQLDLNRNGNNNA